MPIDLFSTEMEIIKTGHQNHQHHQEFVRELQQDQKCWYYGTYRCWQDHNF